VSDHTAPGEPRLAADSAAAGPTAPGESRPAAPPPGFAAPQGYGQPAAYAPPAGYGQPTAYAPPAGYARPPQGYGPFTPHSSPPVSRGGAGLGIVALVLAVVTTLTATVLGSYASYFIGMGAGSEIAMRPVSVDFDWSILTPVRGWVLLGELAFWCGTVLGVWALAQGIVATVKNRGRGWGIAAIVVAIVGPIAFAIGVQVFLTAGFAAGASIGG
jgi:hypothetical protein